MSVKSDVSCWNIYICEACSSTKCFVWLGGRWHREEGTGPQGMHGMPGPPSALGWPHGRGKSDIGVAK